MDLTIMPTMRAYGFYRAIGELIDARADAEHWTLEDVTKGCALILVDTLANMYAPTRYSQAKLERIMADLFTQTVRMAALQCEMRRQGVSLQE